MFTHIGGITMHIQLDGPPGERAVLLLHSLGTNLHIWDAQAHMLAGSFRVIRYDLRGHGLSETGSGKVGITDFAADALTLLDTLGVAHAHVAGVSIGGLIAQAMAEAAPLRVSSLMLCDTAIAIRPADRFRERAEIVRARGMAPIADETLARWVTPGFLGSAEAAGLRIMLLRTDPEGYAQAALAIGKDDRTSATKTLRMPTLVLVGEEDVATPPTAAEALRDAIPGARLVVIPGAAHIPTVQQPELVNAALHGFLAAQAS
jgi:3-oxoadipate enol-lactonase